MPVAAYTCTAAPAFVSAFATSSANFSFAVESFDYERFTQISEEISIPTTIELRGYDFMKKELARCAEEGIEWKQAETVWVD